MKDKTLVFVQEFDVIEKRICGFKYTSKEYMRIIHTPDGDLIANTLDVMVVDNKGDYMLISSELLTKHHTRINTLSVEDMCISKRDIKLLEIVDDISSRLLVEPLILGSLALTLHGCHLGRESKDLDLRIIVPNEFVKLSLLKRINRFYGLANAGEASASDFSTTKEIDDILVDFDIQVESDTNSFHTQVDLRETSSQDYFCIAPIWEIIQWKNKYAAWNPYMAWLSTNSEEKHREDLENFFGDVYTIKADKTFSNTHFFKEVQEQKEKTYDVYTSMKVQKQHCEKVGSPVFAPNNCFRCGESIYTPKRTKTMLGVNIAVGVSVEQASSEVITGCPHCHYSFIS